MNDEKYAKVVSLLTVLLLCMVAGIVIGYTVGVGHGERNAAAICLGR